MNVDIIRFQQNSSTDQAKLTLNDFVSLAFRTYRSPSPDMLIWLMVAYKNKSLFPWWTYEPNLDVDVQQLSDNWLITNQQELFDCLFFAFLKRFVGSNLYVIFPGNIKSEGWTHLKEADRSTYLRGQGCIYHLQGEFDTKLNINWVPYWQPQSVVKDPPFISLWRLFSAGASDSTMSVSFFGLNDPTKLPEVLNLLINQEESRSERMADLTDWFGFYSSPRDEKHSPSSVIYSRKKDQIERFNDFQSLFDSAFLRLKEDLLSSPHPGTIRKFLSRYIAL